MILLVYMIYLSFKNNPENSSILIDKAQRHRKFGKKITMVLLDPNDDFVTIHLQ